MKGRFTMFSKCESFKRNLESYTPLLRVQGTVDVRRRDKSFFVVVHSPDARPTVSLVYFYQIELFSVVHLYGTFASRWRKKNEKGLGYVFLISNAQKKFYWDLFSCDHKNKLRLTFKRIQSSAGSQGVEYFSVEDVHAAGLLHHIVRVGVGQTRVRRPQA